MPIIGILIAIGLVCGLLIYLVFLRVPQKVKGLEKTEELTGILPGMNCGACGHPGCFGYAQALTQNPDLVTRTPCQQVMKNPESRARLEKALGCSLDAAALSQKALIHCAGNSETIADYSGIPTCKAAAQLMHGNRRCLFACLGLGDCLAVCPEQAIAIDPEKPVALVNQEKCLGCGLCVKECPQGLIELAPAGAQIGFLCNYKPIKNTPGRERCDFGCSHCRRCFKACDYGAITWNQETALPEFNQEKCVLCLKCLEACPRHTLGDLAKPCREKEAVSATA